MAEKEVAVQLVLVILIGSIAFLLISGCGKDELEVCDAPMVIIDGVCCNDADNNTVCDETPIIDTPPATAASCGDRVCDNQTENCSNCWQDCGACKKIVYIYVPRNFTLGEFTNDLNILTRDGIKFRKDIESPNNVSNFFYYSKPVSRYYADFLDKRFKFLQPSRWIVLNNIFLENFYVNDSKSLLRYVNYSNWYLTYDLRSAETDYYDSRITTDKATKDYPSPPTGYKKENRYEDWEFRNYSKQESVLYENVTVLANGMVESLYASITDYDIIYKYHSYHDKDTDTIIEDTKSIEEKRLTYFHTINLICARNLVVTLYDWDYDTEYCRITPECIADQVTRNRQDLIRLGQNIKSICDQKYQKKVFIYS